VRANARFTIADLERLYRQSGWPFLLAADFGGDDVQEFASRQRPDLLIVLGEPRLSQELRGVPTHGLIRVSVQGVANDAIPSPQKEIDLKLEYCAKGSERPSCLASLTLPGQAYDGILSRSLKSDLIADDLLVQAAKRVGEGSEAQASKKVKEWMQRIFSPYLDQFQSQDYAAPRAAFYPRRYRSILRLFAQSLLSCPWVIGRNWCRRLRGRYPVLILTHHLVSDRPHRMGIPTEEFWRQVSFLRRHYRIVSLSEGCELLSSGSVKTPTVVLTFDDGYCDNFVTLRAVSEETEAPVTLYVATQPVEDHREFQHDLENGTQGFLALTWDQIRYWNLQGAEFGSHTRTHFDCGATDRARLQQEIVGSKQDLEDRLGQPVKFFAFPFGKPENISPQAEELVAATYTFFDSSLGGENLPHAGGQQRHLLRKNFYADPWELELEAQSIFDLVQKTKLRFARPFSARAAQPLEASQ
jgi:peptidoglycan/xylan/chitin deacetylase (PgdA/CDA1 family)